MKVVNGLLRSPLSFEESRNMQNKAPQGMTMKSIKHHPCLIPLFGVMTFAVGLLAVFSVRSMFKMPDVSWRKKEEPYNEIRNRQWKVLNPLGTVYKESGEGKEAFEAIEEARAARKDH